MTMGNHGNFSTLAEMNESFSLKVPDTAETFWSLLPPVPSFSEHVSLKISEAIPENNVFTGLSAERKRFILSSC